MIQKVKIKCDLHNDLFEEKLLLPLLYKNRRQQWTQRAFRKRRAKPRSWVQQILTKREELGKYHHLIQELKLPTSDLKNIFL